ncbi:uncharacterized protein LOC111623717 [Centruroides sculpturatus]|uniref:uncharacterized protein LOC111623717 n=1 Tax=Centruroides sculpturatus TaxID=218467 RepID=UPI000C6DCCC9|nr:uncharacterized protein LOC111623717 [Centruroides sculpturatus]
MLYCIGGAMSKTFYKSLDIEEEDVLIFTFAFGLFLSIIYIFNKFTFDKDKSDKKCKTNDTKVETVIRYNFDDDGVDKIRNVSGLGLRILMFVFEDYPGFCCQSCGPIFHVDVEVKDKSEFLRCSLCSKDLRFEECEQVKKLVQISKLSSRKLGNLLVKCSKYTFGCNLNIPLKKLKEHLQHCPYIVIPCPQGCGSNVVKRELLNHLNNHTGRGGYSNEPIIPSCPPPPYPKE